jgi:hypothetical protein
MAILPFLSVFFPRALASFTRVVGNNWFSVALDDDFTKPFFFNRSVVMPGMAGKSEKCHQGLIRGGVDAAVGVPGRNIYG